MRRLMADNPMEREMRLRLPQSVADRADALIARLAQHPELAAAGRVTRATVLRLAMMRGLALLEQEYPEPAAEG
jgi:hypothetical protein